MENHKTQLSTRRPDIFADINNANPNIPAAKLKKLAVIQTPWQSRYTLSHNLKLQQHPE
jgi:hypothetical protein